jgi:hypothetical protein
VAERWILERLRNQRLSSLGELNQAIAQLDRADGYSQRLTVLPTGVVPPKLHKQFPALGTRCVAGLDQAYIRLRTSATTAGLFSPSISITCLYLACQTPSLTESIASKKVRNLIRLPSHTGVINRTLSDP